MTVDEPGGSETSNSVGDSEIPGAHTANYCADFARVGNTAGIDGEVF